jgi:4-oxalomesaconate tautomerase
MRESIADSGVGLPCMILRGGTSRGAFFLAEDLPAAVADRDELLRRVLGSPDVRQTDGIGGGHPLTSKVAIVSRSNDPRADVDYLFLQVGVDDLTVSDRQNCGNLLAAVGQFAVERGLVAAPGHQASVRIRMVNSTGYARSSFALRAGQVDYRRTVDTVGVPFAGARCELEFIDTAGSVCGALLPTGSHADTFDGIAATCIDNGMPIVLVRAADLGVTGYETIDELESDDGLRQHRERLRVAAGAAMGLGTVSELTIPKVCLIAPPRSGGAISTRTFIPLRCHASIGVLAAAGVAAACQIAGTVAAGIAVPPLHPCEIEVPAGTVTIAVAVDQRDSRPVVTHTSVVRAARKIFDGLVYP